MLESAPMKAVATEADLKDFMRERKDGGEQRTWLAS